MKSNFLKFEGNVIAWRIIRRIYAECNSVFIETDDGKKLEFSFDSDEMARDGITYILRVLNNVD